MGNFTLTVQPGHLPLTNLIARSMLWALTDTVQWAGPLCTSIETFTIVLTSIGCILLLRGFPFVSKTVPAD